MTMIDLATLEAIAGQRRFDTRTIEIGKRLLIHGEDAKRLSHEYGINLQRVYAIRKEVLAAAQAVALPPGWERLTIAGPREVIARVKRQFDDEMSRLRKAL